jgi:hypothetical protein
VVTVSRSGSPAFRRRRDETIRRVTKLEVATAGDPTVAVMRASAAWWRIDGGGVNKVTISHDDGCPCLHRRGLPACTCEIIGLEARRVA